MKDGKGGVAGLFYGLQQFIFFFCICSKYKFSYGLAGDVCTKRISLVIENKLILCLFKHAVSAGINVSFGAKASTRITPTLFVPK